MASGPGKHYRKGITLKEIFKMFPDDATAEAWFVKQRWADGVTCPHCGSDNVQTGAKHKTMPFRCREKTCAKRFSAKTGTIMEGSNIGFQDWMIGTCLLTTSLESVSSMKLHRELGITQKSAWFMAHRLRKAIEIEQWEFSGPVEVDESYFGGKGSQQTQEQEAEGRARNEQRAWTISPERSGFCGWMGGSWCWIRP